jgi:hypothetical protein
MGRFFVYFSFLLLIFHQRLFMEKLHNTKELFTSKPLKTFGSQKNIFYCWRRAQMSEMFDVTLNQHTLQFIQS